MKLRSAPKKASRRLRGGRVINPSRVFRGLLMFAGIIVLLAIVVVAIKPAWLQQGVAQLESRWGGSIYAYDRSYAEKISALIGAYLRGARDLDGLPELIIDVPYKEMRKIYQKREEALERGNLIQGEDDFVKGDIQFEGKSIPVKLRLKGDWNDHLAGRKWSFRIHVRRGEHLFGMRRFSIQSPATRGYQSELLYFKVLNQFGIMTPRYSFANVMLNGEPIGIMAIEEFFAKELLEHNGRREGVIVRFDESLVWASRDGYPDVNVGWRGAFDYYRNAPVDAFGSGRIAESEYLTGQYKIAEGLLRGYMDGSLSAEQVFDVEQLGRFIAVSDLFGTWHAIAWHNLRFYLNPITMRLEPIPFDATLQDHMEEGISVINDEPLLIRMMQNPRVMAVYQQTLQELAGLVDSGELQEELGAVEAEYLPLLRTEFRLLGSYPLDYLRPRAEALLKRFAAADSEPANELYLYLEKEEMLYQVLAHMRLTDLGEGPVLEIENAVPRDVELLELRWANEESGQEVAVPLQGLPFYLPPRGIESAPMIGRFPLDNVPEGDGWQLKGNFRLANRPWMQTETATVSYAPLKASPIPAASLEAVLKRYRFIRYTEGSNQLLIPAGRWRLAESLILPAGYDLQIAEGATLQFGRDALMIVNGALQVNGTAVNGVTFDALDGVSWPGLLVSKAPVRSEINYLTVRNTSGVGVNGWSLTGGVNFYESDVNITGSRFENSLGEDALNIIHSEFTIRDTLIKGTASDAFDSDFSIGEVVNSRFEEVGKAGGGDAVDVSGTSISVSASSFVDVSDKALSVGERSQMTATDIDMNEVGTAGAAKDGSFLRLSNARVNGASFAGLTAYIKKPEYGPARIEAEDIEFKAVQTPVLVQKDNVVVLDEVEVETQDVDVDALYETVMRKGLKR